MKHLLLIFLLFSFVLYSQNDESQATSEEGFKYKIDGYVVLNEFDRNKKEIVLDGKKFEAGRYQFNEIGKFKYKTDKQEFDYYLLQIVKFKSKIDQFESDSSSADSLTIIPYNRFFRRLFDTAYGEKKKIKNELDIVDIGDQNEIFWLKADRFEKYIEDGYIKKRYNRPIQIAYGASFTVPFKIRPEVQDLNMKITPELMLGGYLGLRKRLDRYKSVYLYLPVGPAGVTTLGINSDNVISEEQVDESVKDGLVLARTFSIGSFIEFNSFQVGVVLGWDKAGGEIGKDWVYNDRPWYSFSIGYNFLRKKDE